MNHKVDAYIDKSGKWQGEVAQLRKIILGCGLTEELKWGNPCYTWEQKNVVLIHSFKDYCAVLFFKGALLPDPDGLLVQQTKNVQAARQARFTSLQEIKRKKYILRTYIQKAIEVEKAGLKVTLKKTVEFPVPEEFKARLKKTPELKTAFRSLTPGRQRAYLLHFAAPKQSATRTSRIERCIPLILRGKGLNDR